MVQVRDETSSDPQVHFATLRGMLEDVIQHARRDVGRVEDAKAQALFETTAEVLQGLVTAYTHAAERSEAAWR